jgi:hypothetical protein
MNEYKIGHKYKVPCAIFTQNNRYYVLPVYPYPHNDSENGQQHIHYHVDFRFIHKKHHNKKTRLPIRIELDGRANLLRICMRKRTYYRNEHTEVTATSFIKNSELDMSNVHRLRCPHKGYDLSTLTPDNNGIVRCPLHNLKIKMACKLKDNNN